MSRNFHRRCEKLKGKVAKYHARREMVFNIRLVLGLLIVALLATPPSQISWGVRIPAFVLSVVIFSYFVVVSGRVRNFIEKLDLLINFYKRQSDRILGSATVDMANFEPAALDVESAQLHRDFDLFGSHSLWTFISETFSDFGQSTLVRSLTSPNLLVSSIQEKQRQVARLSLYLGYCRKFVILGQQGRSELLEMHRLVDELNKPGFTNKHQWILAILLVIWFCYIAEVMISQPGRPFFTLIFPLVSLLSLAALKGVYTRALTVSVLFFKLTPVLEHLHRLDPHVRPLFMPKFSGEKPLLFVRKFDRALSALTVNSHPLLALILNAFIPWNFFFSFILENHRKKLATILPDLLVEMGKVEELASFVFLKRYRATTFPELREQPHLKAQSLYHPMGGPQFVANDINIGQPSLILLTGSNMSGKSTFMRTLGLNQILALAGAPVFAHEFSTFPAPIRSCIRVSDSLREGSSYFYAEVRRLKSILAEIRAGKVVIYLVDEIFKGTNNRERFLGSQELILELSRSASIGIISTHDLDLAALEKDSAKIQNWHFTDSVKENRLIFHYKIKKGPSPSTNALKIMALEGLIDRKGVI